MFTSPGIQEEDLRACLLERYNLAAIRLEPLPLGLDRWAVVYRFTSEQGASYLVKARASAFYEPGCLVPRYLRDQGVAAVVASLPTRTNTLWTLLEGWTVTVYPFIEGERGWNPAMTDAQWAAVGTALCQIHQAALPAEGFSSLRQETFDPTGYSRAVRAFESQHLFAEGGAPLHYPPGDGRPGNPGRCAAKASGTLCPLPRRPASWQHHSESVHQPGISHRLG